MTMPNQHLLATNGIESSTDTLVPEADVEERRTLYCSALRQEHQLRRCQVQTPNKEHPQLLSKPFKAPSVDTVAVAEEATNSTKLLGQEKEGQQLMMVRTCKGRFYFHSSLLEQEFLTKTILI